MSMKTIKNRTPFEIHSKELVCKWYKHWANEIRKRISSDFDISEKEIYSEITHNCIYLSGIFKDGNFPAYCNQYVVSLSVRSIWKEYNMIDHDCLADAYDEFEEGENYEEKHVIVKADLSAKSDEENRHENVRMMTLIYEAADKLDKATEGYYQYANIIDDIRMGMSFDEIAEEIGTYKMDISRRLAKIKEEARNRKETEK